MPGVESHAVVMDIQDTIGRGVLRHTALDGRLRSRVVDAKNKRRRKRKWKTKKVQGTFLVLTATMCCYVSVWTSLFVFSDPLDGPDEVCGSKCHFDIIMAHASGQSSSAHLSHPSLSLRTLRFPPIYTPCVLRHIRPAHLFSYISFTHVHNRNLRTLSLCDVFIQHFLLPSPGLSRP